MKKKRSYKRTEKIWLALVIIFYVLYNLPGIPPCGKPDATLWHALLTIVPLWAIIYFGLITLIKQRRLKPEEKPLNVSSREENA
jgi:hypothetical protein